MLVNINQKLKTMSKKRSSFRGKVSSDAKRQKSAASSYGYLQLPRDVSVFKEDPGGRAFLDIMPYEVSEKKHPDRNDDLDIAVIGGLWYKRPFKIHRNVGVENDSVVCPTSIGKKCPICEYRSKRVSEGAEKEETDTMKVSKRNLYIVIPTKNKNYEAVPHIWDISQYLFQNLLNDELEEDENYEVFPDVEDGLTLKIRFDSKTIGKSQPFAEASRIDFMKREDPYTEDILEDVPNLDEALKILSYSELNAKFFELDEDDEDDKEKEEEPPEEKPARRERKTLKKEEPEPEPEPEDKPTRRERKRKEKEPENKCPHGHVFGKDCDEKDECEDCDLWSECVDAQDALKK